MSRSNRLFSTLALSLLLASTSLSSAYAQSTAEAIERLKTIMAQQDVTLEWERADIDGDDAVLVGARVEAADESTAIGDITLSGIARADQGYRIESVSLDELTLGDENMTVVVGESEVAGMLLPDDAFLDQYGGTVFYDSMTVSSMTFSSGGDEIATMGEFYTEMTAPADGNPMEYSGNVEEFFVDLSIVQDLNQAAIIKALGYEEVTGSVEFAGEWQPADGRFVLSQMDVIVDDAGTLGFTLDLGGYTPAFLSALRELGKQAAEETGDDSAQGMAMLGLMQQLTFHGAEVAFADDSITNKVLEFVAASQGSTPANIANQAKAVLPFALAQLGNPDLTMQASQAVSAYLDNPQSLRIRAVPQAPVPFALIAAAAMSAPTELTKTLGVSVIAND